MFDNMNLLAKANIQVKQFGETKYIGFTTNKAHHVIDELYVFSMMYRTYFLRPPSDVAPGCL